MLLDLVQHTLVTLSGNCNFHVTSHLDQLKMLKQCPVWKLRWSTLGLHHDWNSKVYSQDQCSPFPTKLSKLSKLFASAVGWTNYNAQVFAHLFVEMLCVVPCVCLCVDEGCELELVLFYRTLT